LGPYRYQCLIRVLTRYDIEERTKITGITNNERITLQVEPFRLDVSPYSLFVGSIRSPVTKEKYLQRMRYFFDYLSIHHHDAEGCFEVLTQKANADINWLANEIFSYIQVHKGRVERREISAATLRNYIKPIRLYCEQMDIPIPWKKLMRGCPLEEWMNYRKACGEVVTGESWLMRNLWDVTTPKGKGVVTVPKRLKATGIKRLIERALWAQGIRSELGKGRRRHEFQADHGFRKWFKTRCE
jgi:hypothetical protein